MARTLIDTLGAIALTGVGTPSPWSQEAEGEETRRSTGPSSSGANGNSPAPARDDQTPGGGGDRRTSAGAFGLAVDELAGMCGEDGHGTEAAGGVQGWALLGLALR